MREPGIAGVMSGKVKRTTRPVHTAVRVQRTWLNAGWARRRPTVSGGRPDVDRHLVGFAFTALTIDAISRGIIGRGVAAALRAEVNLDACDMAIGRGPMHDLTGPFGASLGHAFDSCRLTF